MVPGCSVRYQQRTVAIYPRSLEVPMAIITLSSPRMNLYRSMDSISPAETVLFDCRQSTVTCSSFSTASSSSPELTSDTTGESVVTPDSDNDGETSPTVRPKIEELEDSFSTLDVLEETKPAIVTLPHPKKRGRPRKHPIVEQRKTSHARSKTGCGTCRRRKKKCDETKPVCQNCEKNNVVCDGYELPQQWRSGKQRSQQSFFRYAVGVPATLPQLIRCVETPVDRMFYQHFTRKLGNVLSLTDRANPFLELIVPMAKDHDGLMHSLLYLSGSCLLAEGLDHPDWEQRQEYHCTNAMMLLREDLNSLTDSAPEGSNAVVSIGDPTIAQTLILCLQTVCSGDLFGSYRHHLDAMKAMLTNPNLKFPDEKLRRFILEFLLYHDYSSTITSLKNPLDQRSIALMEDFALPDYMIPPQAGTLLGVLDGLFTYISRIRLLRDQIRQDRDQGAQHIHPNIEQEALALDELLRDWTPSCAPDTPRHVASLLYKQCTWLYLARTMSPSKREPQFKQAVDQGLHYLRILTWDVHDGSMQSILLMPLFLLGCAAFEPEQRPEISQAFQSLQEWSKLGNIKFARQIVEEVWQMMDEGREHETWDWETIIARKGWDFLHSDCIEQSQDILMLKRNSKNSIKNWKEEEMDGRVLYSAKSFRLHLGAHQQHSYEAGLQRRAKYEEEEQIGKEENSGISLATSITTAFLGCFGVLIRIRSANNVLWGVYTNLVYGRPISHHDLGVHEK
ncbi:hypothetical protein AC579_5328 [Pseudocercospora musae]|uniref:Zn(2)-C6 fungal-type domain-containing protein n=1 Tax=Pseudocercospora musae TaxID=113226 RepID=A0A139IST1_9PEZI|nr:hypothetical protein AC579_5328 [Pseudocercospora musae]